MAESELPAIAGPVPRTRPPRCQPLHLVFAIHRRFLAAVNRWFAADRAAVVALAGLHFQHIEGPQERLRRCCCAARFFGPRSRGGLAGPPRTSQGGPAGADIEEGQGTRRCRKVFAVAARTAGRGMTTRPEDRDPQRVWRRLRENPDYVADWRASAGPTAREAPPLAFRATGEQDLEVIESLRAGGTTILMVEQMARLALKVSDRAYVLEHGRIVHEGASADLLDDPRVLGAYLGSEAASGWTAPPASAVAPA